MTREAGSPEFTGTDGPETGGTGKSPSSLLRLWVFLYIHTKIPRFTGCLCSLSGIKIHESEFLYNIAREAQQTAGRAGEFLKSEHRRRRH
jgi:hypothetical protein